MRDYMRTGEVSIETKEMFRAAGQRDILHDRISGQDLGYNEILEEARKVKIERPNK